MGERRTTREKRGGEGGRGREGWREEEEVAGREGRRERAVQEVMRRTTWEKSWGVKDNMREGRGGEGEGEGGRGEEKPN